MFPFLPPRPRLDMEQPCSLVGPCRSWQALPCPLPRASSSHTVARRTYSAARRGTTYVQARRTAPFPPILRPPELCSRLDRPTHRAVSPLCSCPPCTSSESANKSHFEFHFKSLNFKKKISSNKSVQFRRQQCSEAALEAPHFPSVLHCIALVDKKSLNVNQYGDVFFRSL